ncbi:MAG: hypothetical protein J7M34_04500, partial [Anaerolineae bacterium]|nr:hypothetical protein [Anaerolineae bacterium]
MIPITKLRAGTRLYDHHFGRERQLYRVEIYGSVAFLSFLDPQTGTVDRQPFPVVGMGARSGFLVAGPRPFGAARG